MLRKSLLELALDKDSLSILPSQSLPEGVESDIIYAIWDIGTKWGKDDDDEEYKCVSFLAGDFIIKIYDQRPYGGSLGMTLAYGFGVMTKGSSVFYLQGDIRVLWDNRLTADYVRKSVNVIDHTGRGINFLVDGSRIPLEKITFLVKDIFSESETIWPIKEESFEQAIARFDHPEFLTGVELEFWGMVVCLKVDAEKVVQRYRRETAILLQQYSREILQEDVDERIRRCRRWG